VSWRLPVPEWTVFLRFGKFSAIILLNLLHNPFGLHLFTFFNVHDSQVCSFDGVAEFLHIPFSAFESSKSSFVFSLLSILSSSS
jgi:hypothetical protein